MTGPEIATVKSSAGGSGRVLSSIRTPKTKASETVTAAGTQPRPPIGPVGGSRAKSAAAIAPAQQKRKPARRPTSRASSSR